MLVQVTNNRLQEFIIFESVMPPINGPLPGQCQVATPMELVRALDERGWKPEDPIVAFTAEYGDQEKTKV